jgi:hypothetical protein
MSYTVVAQFQSGHVASENSDSAISAVQAAGALHATGFTEGVTVYADSPDGPVMIASHGAISVPYTEPSNVEARPNPAPLVDTDTLNTGRRTRGGSGEGKSE